MSQSEIQPRPFQNPVHFLAFGFGSGLAPKAPGTFGTVAAVPLYLLLAGLPLWGYSGVVLLAALLVITFNEGLSLWLVERLASGASGGQ